MTTKAEWKARALAAENGLHPLSRPLTYRTLTVDFTTRTIAFDGRVHPMDPKVREVDIPIISTEHPIIPKNPR